MSTKPTDQETQAIIDMMSAVGGVIKELGSVPSGHLYAQLMGLLRLDVYEATIDTLVRLKLVRRDRNHMLTWIGGE